MRTIFKSLLVTILLLLYVSALRHVGSQLPNQGSNLPLALEDEVLTTGQPGKSLPSNFEIPPTKGKYTYTYLPAPWFGAQLWICSGQ